ncbi:MAG: group 1 truncated hemoglobin [Proteobacteria bacterium]|nr:group 1 truncated hemoglobin [Pseudomonadota bacterium]
MAHGELVAGTLYEQLGGETALRAIIGEFIDAVFDDPMIGFFFRSADKKRIKMLELQHASELLGGPHRYRGRPLDKAHAKHPIMGGHFDRRLQLLRETLERREAPIAVIETWIEHSRALRPLITGDPDSNCNAERALAKVGRSSES